MEERIAILEGLGRVDWVFCGRYYGVRRRLELEFGGGYERVLRFLGVRLSKRAFWKNNLFSKRVGNV